jgi:asparagine synthase (glutamine-hydrolysing)
LIFRSNSGEDTFFKNIKKVLPGHFIVFDLKSKTIRQTKYWDINFSPENKPLNYFTNGIYSILNDAVEKRMISDVPFGAYLSGGVDSGAIVSLMSKKHNSPINTFSVGFEIPCFSFAILLLVANCFLLALF